MGSEAEEPRRTRPSKLDVIVGMLHLLQLRSTCKRAGVAALVVDRDFRAIHAMGYNGPARGEDDLCRNEAGNCGCVHAEANALIKLRTFESDLILVSTTAPCEMCARLIVNSKVIYKVAYLQSYRSVLGLDVLRRAKIELQEIKSVDHKGEARSVCHLLDWEAVDA